jgi:DNA polymerase III subunit epsilon
MFGWGRRKNEPEFVRNYCASTGRKFDRKRSFGEIPFVALDAETTGFDINKDRLLSIGIVPLNQGALDVANRQTWLVQQAASPNNEAVKIHGIAPSESAKGIPEAQVLEELLAAISGKVIVGHHIGFDAEIIGNGLRRNFGIKFRNRMIDTSMMAMRHLDAFHRTGYANQRPPGLDEVCVHAGLPVLGRHTASGDAFTTGQLFLWICGRLRVRYGRQLVAGDLLK